MFLAVLIFLSCMCISNGQHDCNPCVDNWITLEPGILSRFPRQVLCELCLRSRAWTDRADVEFRETNTPWTTPGQQSYMSQFHCQGRECLRGLPGNVVRKEYRVMSEQERWEFHEALRAMKMDMVDGMSKYDLFVTAHQTQFAPGAHGGAAFLPFHREYLKQLELDLRQYYPNVAITYWDSTLDEGLPDPVHSILWTREFLGTGQGYVTDGPFANWQTFGTAYQRLFRQVGNTQSRSNDYLYNDRDLDLFTNQFTSFWQFDRCHDSRFEDEHAGVHLFVGGHMINVTISPNDPAFFLHHCFIDYMWEMFRNRHQNSREYSPDRPDCTPRHHMAQTRMSPFQIRNMDGLSDRYVPELYTYQQRPQCDQFGNGCVPASPYLFCNRRIRKCLSKIVPGGNCLGLDGEDACYLGRCMNGRCV